MKLRSHHLRLRKAIRPNPPIIMPEILFTQRNLWGVNLVRNRLTPLLKINHHRAEPISTPKTNTAAEAQPPLAPPTPNPANIATKERIVMGFVIVRKKVEA